MQHVHSGKAGADHYGVKMSTRLGGTYFPGAGSHWFPVHVSVLTAIMPLSLKKSTLNWTGQRGVFARRDLPSQSELAGTLPAVAHWRRFLTHHRADSAFRKWIPVSFLRELGPAPKRRAAF
jgi:hypothetical protein